MKEKLEQFFHITSVLTGVLGCMTWLGLMLASLPGAEVSKSIYARMIRGMFYVHPVLVIMTVCLIRYYVDSVPVALLLAAVPLLPIGLMWLIFGLWERSKVR